MADIINPGNGSEPAEYTVGSLDIDDNQSVSYYASQPGQYPVENLEVHDPNAVKHSNQILHPIGNSFKFSRRRAMIASLIITLVVVILSSVAMLFLVRYSAKQNDSSQLPKQQDVTLRDAQDSVIPKELQGAEQSLLVNGDIVTRGSFKVSDGTNVTVLRVQEGSNGNQTVTLPTGSGTICISTNNCDYASLPAFTALQNDVSSLQGQVGNISAALEALSAKVPPVGVEQLNGQKGSVSIQGSLNQINVATSNGVVTLSTPQNLDANANVQFGNLTVSPTGEIKANRLAQTGAGNSISIDAGNDFITFTAGGRVFQLPNSGGASQTICTTGASCASGGGTAVLLAPGIAQQDNAVDASLFINDVGGGNLIQMQSGGVDRLVVANNGNTTVSGSLTVSGLGNGFVKSTAGALSVVSAIDLSTADVTNVLPVSNGGTGLNTIPANGVVIGNGASSVSTAVAGASGLCLMSTAGAPTFQACPGSTDFVITSPVAGQVLIYNATSGKWENQSVTGDLSINETGATTIANNAVTTSKIADGNVTNAKLQNSSLTVTAGTGLSGGGAVSLGASTNLAVVYGSTANTSVQGNTVLTITAGTGLTGGGSVTLGAGGTSTLNVAYGSTANTAVQGNTSLTCASGTGNLSGGGNVITLGAGGACGDLTITNSPIFSGTLAVQGATATIGASGQQGSVVLYDGASGVSANTGTVQVIGSLGQNTTYILPDPSSATATICLSTGNCAGAGGGVTTVGGTNGKIAKFTGSNTIADTTLSESGSTVTASGNIIIQGSNSLTLGTSSSLDGSIKFNNANGIHTVSLQAPATDPAADLTFRLPSSYGSNGDCLQSNGSGGLSFSACTGGAGGGVTSLNGQTGVISIANASGSSGVVTLNDASTIGKGIAQFNSTNFSVLTGVVNTIQNIDTTATPTFAGLTLSGFSSGLVISNGSGLLSSGTVDRNSALYFSNGLSVINGGTGLTAAPGNGQLLIGNGTGYTLANLTNADGTVQITNGAGSIDISVPRADQCSTCADYTLSNLADVIAINKSLLPASAGAINLGGSSVPYGLLYLSGSSASPASNNFTIGGTATTARTINLPDASGTVCLLETCLKLQSGSPPGTAQTGNVNLNGTVTATNLVLGSTATINVLTPSAATSLTLGATGAGQSTNLQGNTISFTNGSATYTFNSSAAGSQTICDTSGNCAGTGGGVIASGGSAYNLPVFTSSNTVTNSIIGQDAGATTATVTGILKVTGNSFAGTGALTVSSTGGANALNLNSGSGTLGLTGTTATIQRVGSSLTLDVNSGAASTLTVTNSNVGQVANLSVEGGVNIGSGQTYKINGTDINTAGTLNNVAYLNQNNSFTGGGNTSFAGTLTGGTYNGQTISSSAAFTGTLSVAGANSLTLGQASTNTGSIIFQNNAGSNTVTLRAASLNPVSSFTLTLPSTLGTTGDCLQQIDGTGTLGFVGCASGLGGSGTTGTIALFTGTTAIGDSLLSQSGSTVSILGSGNFFQVDGTITSGVNGASGSTGKLVLNDGSNPGRAVTVESQQAGSSYTLLLPTSADAGSSCLTLATVSAGVNKITAGSCAAGGTGGNITATGTTNGFLLKATSNGPSYTAAASLVQDNGSGVAVNTAPQASYILTVGSANKFNVTDGGQLEIGTTGGNPLTLGTTGAISNVTTLTASGLLQSSANNQALSLTGAPTNSATQSLFRMGGAIAGGNSAANGGTYIGINAPVSGAGSAADFINFQNNGTSKLKVDKDGNITAGTFNGVTIGGTGALTSGGFTLTLTGNSTLNQDLTTSSAVQFGSLSLSSALMPAYGGTGTDTSGALAGSTLIFNATTGKFEANKLTSSDASIDIISNDGSIDLKVSSCATCANSDLSNLAATTNLNSTLQAQAGIDVGSASNPFRDLYIYGNSASRSSNHFQVTGTATSARTITLPDASGTVCLTATCVTLQGPSPTPQSGYISVTNNISAGGSLIAPSATVNTLTSAAATALVLGATGASQTTSLQGTSITFVDGSRNFVFNPSATGTQTICDTSGNCAGAGGGVTASGGSAFNLPVFNSSNTLINSIISQDAGVGATTATVAGKLIVSASNTSGNSFALSDSSFTSSGNLAQFSFTNANTGASSATVNGIAISPVGTNNANSNANSLTAIKLNNVAAATNNSFYAFDIGTGYNDILRVNSQSLINGFGYVQNAAIDSSLTYSNLQKVGALTVGSIGSGFGTISTANNITTSANISTTGTGTITSASTVTGTTINGTTGINTGAGAGTQRIDNAGALVNITGYSQVSGNFLQSGGGTFGTGTGAISLNGNTTVAAGKSLTITGGNTASRPSATSEGIMYYDQTTHQILTTVFNPDTSTYQWKAAGQEVVLVAANNSSAADKAAADYIADGTGDQVEINFALTAASSAGSRKSGKVHLFAGTYTINGSISVPNNTTLSGAGMSTLITIPNGLNSNFSAIVNTDTTSGTNVTIRDLMLDGNKANQTGTNFGMSGIDFSNMGGGSGTGARPGAVIQNVQSNNWFKNGTTTNCQRGYGICLRNSNNNNVTASSTQGNDGSGLTLSTAQNNIIANNTSQGNGASGYAVTTSSNNTLTGNLAQGNTTIGFDLGGSSKNTLTGNTAQTNAQGFALSGGSNNVLTGNLVQGNTTNGININSSSNSNTITGNKIDDSGSATDNNAIFIAASDSNLITGNNITDTSCTSTCVAIDISNSTSDTNYLADNTIGSGTINNAGTGTVFGGQVNSSGNYQVQPAGTIELMKNTNVTGNLTATGTGSFTGGSLTVSTTTGTDDSLRLSVTSFAGASFQGTITNANLTAARTWTLPDESGVVCIVGSVSCLTGSGFVQFAPASVQADTSTNSSIFINKTGASGNLIDLQKSGVDLFIVNSTGAIQIGSTGNGITLTGSGGVTTGPFTLNGTARNVKNITLNAEYAGAVLDAASDNPTCSGANNGSMTSGYTTSGTGTKPEGFYSWTSTQATAQCYDVVVQIPIPSDFDGFTGTQSIDTWSNDLTNGTLVLDKSVDGVADGSAYGTTLTPISANTWTNKTFTFSGSYSSADANKTITFRIRMTASKPGGTAAQVNLGRINLQYNAKF